MAIQCGVREENKKSSAADSARSSYNARVALILFSAVHLPRKRLPITLDRLPPQPSGSTIIEP